MQTFPWTQKLAQFVAVQSQSPQVNNGRTSGTPRTNCHQYGPSGPAVPYTGDGEIRQAAPSTPGRCLPHTNGGHWGQTLNQQSSMFQSSQHTTTKQKVIMASNPSLLSLLTKNNKSTQYIDATLTSENLHSLQRWVNSAAPYTLQQEHLSFGSNNDNFQRLETGRQSAAPHSTTCVNNLQKPAAGSQQTVPGRQGPSAGLAMGRSPNQVNNEYTVYNEQDSTRISVQVPHQGHSETPTCSQSAQETHSVASRPSSMSLNNNNQLLRQMFQNPSNINRLDSTWVPGNTSNHSQIFPSPPLTFRNNNAAVGQFMPTHSHNPPVPNHPASRLIATTQEHNRKGAIGNNAQHAMYGGPYTQSIGHNMHNNADAASVPKNHVKSSIQHSHRTSPPPYPGKHSNGHIRNKTGHAVRTEDPSLQNVPNLNSTKTIKYKEKSAYVQESNADPTSVPSHCMQFSSQNNCESILPSYHIRQGYYIKVAEDKSINGFRAENVLIFMGDKPNESGSVLQGSTADNASSFLTQHKAIAVVQPLSPCMQKNTPIDGAVEIPLTTQGLSLSTGDVSNHGEESCGRPSQPRTSFTQSTSLTDKQEVPKSRPEDASELGSEKTLTQEPEMTVVEKAMTHSSFDYEISKSNCLLTERVDAQLLSNFDCQITQSKELSDTEVTTRQHVNLLNEEPNEQTVSEEEIFELASVPVISWTLEKLKELIKTMKPTECFATHVENKILSLYWEGDGEKLTDVVRSDSFQNIFEEVRSVCGDCDMPPQSVIFSQVRCKNGAKLLEKCDILKYNSVFPSLPEHKSSWLNTNEQLDDIDKVFGFPWSLLNGQYSRQSKDELKPICPVNEKSFNTTSNVQTEELTSLKRPTSSESDAKETVGSIVAHCSMQTMSPAKGESEGIIYNDPFSSLVINVLPPEEAMRFFSDQLVEDKVDDEEPIELAEEINVKTIELKMDSVQDISSKGLDEKFVRNDGEMEDYCCLSRWMAVFTGSSVSSCKCQTILVSAKNTVYAEELSTTNGTIEGLREENQGDIDKPDFTGIEDCHTIVLSESGSETGPDADGTGNLDLSEDQSLSLNNCSNIVEVEIEDIFSNYEDFLKVAAPMSELVWDNVLPKQKHLDLPLKNMEHGTLEEQNPTGVEFSPTVTNLNLPPQPTNKISFLSSLSLAHRIPKHLSPKRNNICKVKQKSVGLKRRYIDIYVPGKRRKIMDGFGTNPELISEGNLTDTHVEFESTNTTTQRSVEEKRPSKDKTLLKPKLRTNIWKASTVRLALFGSKQTQNGTPATNQHKDHHSSQLRRFADKYIAPPETLCVNVNSNTRTFVEGPVKHRILHEWKSSFIPTKSKGRVLKQKKTKHFAPKMATVASNTQNVLSSERQVTPARTVNATHTSRDMERERILNGLRLQLKSYRPGVVPQSKSNALEKSEYEMGNPEENSVLRFGVLPQSFTFKDGQESIDAQVPTCSMKEMTNPVAMETESPEATPHKSQGAWSVCPQKSPVKSKAIKGTIKGTKYSSILFQEFQKKFKHKK